MKTKKLDLTDYISYDKDDESTESENNRNSVPYQYLCVKTTKQQSSGYFINDERERVSYVRQEVINYNSIKEMIRHPNLASVFIDPNVLSFVPNLYAEYHIPIGIREIIMLTVAVLAYKFADKESMEKNEFSFEPIREVGWLFLGIFA